MWEELTYDIAHSIAAAANDLPWQGSEPDRFGLTQCVALGSPEVATIGYFIQEIEREQRILTEGKGEQRQMEEHAEKFLFVVLPNLHLVSLQAKRVSRMPPRKDIEARVGDLLRLSFSREGYSFGTIKHKEEGNTPQDYVDAFFSPETLRVTMLFLRNLTGELPANFPFFNPNYELNTVFLRANEDDRRQIAEVRLVAPYDGDLKHSPSARGFIRSSQDPREMRIVTRDGPRKLSTEEENSVRVDVSDMEVDHVSKELADVLIHSTASPKTRTSGHPQRSTTLLPSIIQNSLFE